MGGNLFSRRSQLRNLTDSLDALPCIRSAFSIQPSLVRSLPAKDAEVPVAGIPLVNHFHSFYNLFTTHAQRQTAADCVEFHLTVPLRQAFPKVLFQDVASQRKQSKVQWSASFSRHLQTKSLSAGLAWLLKLINLPANATVPRLT